MSVDDALGPDDFTDAGKAALVYELCCAVCGDYENCLRPLRDYASEIGWVRDPEIGWVHQDCVVTIKEPTP